MREKRKKKNALQNCACTCKGAFSDLTEQHPSPRSALRHHYLYIPCRYYPYNYLHACFTQAPPKPEHPTNGHHTLLQHIRGSSRPADGLDPSNKRSLGRNCCIPMQKCIALGLFLLIFISAWAEHILKGDLCKKSLQVC